MNPAPQRSEPRFRIGTRVRVLIQESDAWRAVSAFTVNVSENGLLVALPFPLVAGDVVRLELPGEDNFRADGVVCHATPGSFTCLVGIRLIEKQGNWLIARDEADSTHN